MRQYRLILDTPQLKENVAAYLKDLSQYGIDLDMMMCYLSNISTAYDRTNLVDLKLYFQTDVYDYVSSDLVCSGMLGAYCGDSDELIDEVLHLTIEFLEQLYLSMYMPLLTIQTNRQVGENININHAGFVGNDIIVIVTYHAGCVG